MNSPCDMARANTILQSDFPYNISGRCINRDWFEVPLEEVWTILCEELYMATILHNLQVHSFVMMANHYHLIVTTPHANISQAMKRFMEMTSKRIGEKSWRINRIWGTRYYKSILGRHSYFLNAYKYNYFNPVKAGIVERCEDYPFSTLRGLLGADKLAVPLRPDTILGGDIEDALSWLNRRPPADQLAAVQSALRRSQFQHVKCPKLRKPILGEDDVI